MPSTQATMPTETTPPLPSAADIRGILDQRKAAHLTEEAHKQQLADKEKAHRKEMFLARTITPEFIERLMTRIRNAAETGETQLLLGHFPSAWCTDGGRAINVREAGWPETLQGFAKDFYEFWDQTLKPLDFQLEVEIMDFPGGMPGDVGTTLSWREKGET